VQPQHTQLQPFTAVYSSGLCYHVVKFPCILHIECPVYRTNQCWLWPTVYGPMNHCYQYASDVLQQQPAKLSFRIESLRSDACKNMSSTMFRQAICRVKTYHQQSNMCYRLFAPFLRDQTPICFVGWTMALKNIFVCRATRLLIITGHVVKQYARFYFTYNNSTPSESSETFIFT